MNDSTPDTSPPRIRLLDWRILPMLGVTALVLYVLVSKLANGESFTAALLNADLRWMAASIGVMATILFLGTYRMILAINSMGHNIPFFRGLDAVLSTWPLALITPSRASDVLRAWVLRDLCPPSEGAGAIVAEKLVDIQSLCLWSIVGGLIIGVWQASVAALLLLIALWVFVIGFVFSGLYKRAPVLKNRAEKIGQILRVFEAFREKPKYFLAVSATSLISWMLAILLVVFLANAFSLDLPYTTVLALWPLSIFVGMLPLTVAGMGTRDAAFVGLLALFASGEFEEVRILATTFSYSLVSAWLLGIIGVPFMLRHFASVFKNQE